MKLTARIKYRTLLQWMYLSYQIYDRPSTSLAMLWLLNMFHFSSFSSHPTVWIFCSHILWATWIWHQFFFFQWEIGNLWSTLWHIWHKMIKQKDRGLCQNRRQLWQRQSWWTYHRWPSLPDWFSYTHLLWSPAAIMGSSSSMPGCGQRNNHVTLPSHSPLSVWISV